MSSATNIHKDSIKAIAQSMGIPGTLSDDVAAVVAQDVEYRIRELTQDAIKFMQHCRRDTLRTDDIDSALRVRNVDSLYGYSSSDPVTFRHMAIDGGEELYFPEDVIVTFDDIIQEPLPVPPPEPTFSVHWLAVEGEQPLCPQNPPPGTSNDTRRVANPEARKRKAAFRNTMMDGKRVKSVEIVEHVLSKEQQLYYAHVTDALKGNDAEVKQAVLKSVHEDAGLHQLLPYFTRFIAEEVANSLNDLPVLMSLMNLALCIISSTQLRVEPYLHQLMPSILTCLVGKRLCKDMASENHWSLRDYSAELSALICRRFGHAYPDLQPRITKTLALAFLSPDKPLTTHYGAIRGLASMGHYVVKLIILPNVEMYLKLLQPSLDDEEDQARRIEAQHCFGALLAATGGYVRNELSWLRSQPFEYSEETAHLPDEEDVTTAPKSRTKRKRKQRSPIPPLTKSQLGTVVHLPVRMDTLFELFGEALLPYTTHATLKNMPDHNDSSTWSIAHSFI